MRWTKLSWTWVSHECFAKIDLGNNAETCAPVVFDTIKNGESKKIIPMDSLQGVTVDIKGASALKDFEVIDIVDDSNTYPGLLGIYWATGMNGVINLKKRKMIFENKSLCVVVPLDPTEGPCYTEPV